MSWEDAVFTFGGLVLLWGLVPAIRSAEKPPRLTCILFSFVLSSFGTAYFSWGAHYAAGIALAQGVGWFLLAVQTRKPIACGTNRR